MSASTHVRIRRSTLERLYALARQLEEESEQGNHIGPEMNLDPINPAHCKVTPDAIVTHLLDQRELHRERDRKAKEKRKRRREGGE